MQINSIGPTFSGNSINSGKLVYVMPTSTISEYNRHEQNIIRTIGPEKYSEVCQLPDAVETKKIAYFLKNLDYSSMIIVGNPYTDDNREALSNHVNKHPELMGRIDKAYIIPSDYENAVFITKSDKEDNIGVDYYMVHSGGKIRIRTPFWSKSQVNGLKDTRYLRSGDVFKIENDNHHIKLETRNIPAEKPKGISTVDFDELL